MRTVTGKVSGSVNRTLSAMIAGSGLASFIFWSLLFVLVAIGNVFYWTGFPYDLGGTSEDVLWGGMVHLLLIVFLISMVPITLVIACSGMLTFAGGMVNYRKGRKLVLGISMVPNLLIMLGLILFLISAFALGSWKVPLSFFIVGPMIASFLVRSVLIALAIFDRSGSRQVEKEQCISSGARGGMPSA